MGHVRDADPQAAHRVSSFPSFSPPFSVFLPYRVVCAEKGIFADVARACVPPSLNAPTEVVKQIIINIEAGVEVEVTIAA